MLNNNGGEPVEDCIFDFYDNVIEKNNASLIRSFFRIYESKPEKRVYDDLEEICETMRREEIISNKTLPIADDLGGNVICISLHEEDYGTVYFANHEFEDTETGYLFMSKISSSFTEFINQLYDNT
jgi:hypothetical protein